MSTKKIWISLACVAFLSISVSAISQQKDEAYADNTNTENQSIQTESTSSTQTLIEPSATATEDKDTRFLSALESTLSMATKESIQQIPDSTKIAAGNVVCESFSKGVTYEEFAIMIIQKYGTSASTTELAGALIGAGVSVYCPEYSYKLP
jgi:hypothetical protein